KINPETSRGISRQTLADLQEITRSIPISEELKQKVIRIIGLTREPGVIEYGASPRASIALILTAKARALIRGRNYVTDEDIRAMAYPVLRHRIILSFDAQRQGMSPDDAISEVLAKV
ncbi:MAG: AAA family ATPase, partial [Methanosarcinaceae archaeon]|nr:AAA family ATPase [Methanosarcinaceae archaeon]